jgi:hypothetical protein
MEDQDGRPGVEDGVDPVVQGQKVGFQQEPGACLQSQSGGQSDQVENRRKLEVH